MTLNFLDFVSELIDNNGHDSLKAFAHVSEFCHLRENVECHYFVVLKFFMGHLLQHLSD